MIRIFLKEGSLLSFFSSGFPSHVRGKAVDIGSIEWDTFYSPVEGVIERIEKFTVGRPNRRAKVNYDFIISIRSGNSSVKILHVEPTKVEGDSVKKGEELGYFISTPYSGGDIPHGHVEGVRFKFPKVTKSEGESVATVVRRSTYYLDLEVDEPAWAGRISGLTCMGGLLNGSIPWACYGGIVGIKLWKQEVNCLGVKLGMIKVSRAGYSLFEMKRGILREWETRASFNVLTNRPICGRRALLEFVLGYGRNPIVRLYRRADLRVGDQVDLRELLSRYL